MLRLILSTGFGSQRQIFRFRTKGFVSRTQHCLCSHRRRRGNIHPPLPHQYCFSVIVYSFVFLILFLTSMYRGLQVIRCGRCCASSSSPFVFCDVRFKLFPRYVFLPFLNFNFPIYNLSCYVRLGFDLLTRICLHIIDRVYSYLYSPKHIYEDAFGKRNFGQVRNFCLFF